MSSARKKKKPARTFGSSLRRVLLALCLIAVSLAAAITFTERRQWPESLRNHDAVIMVYTTRNEMIDAIWRGDEKPMPILPEQAAKKPQGKEPISVRPAPKKPEQGYNAQDRARMEALIEKEGDLP
ncbi:MAG: hypothetical protein RBS08_01365 [Bdellovibrionales bacterium]|jgi:hypothetical protein|nr:hypothetical protein [Bdellovibrionales bacterium]